MENRWKNKYRIPSARLEKWNYAWNALYFVTICTKEKIQFFGNIKNQKMNLNEIGYLVEKYWIEIPQHFNFIKSHDFVVMPNHVHGILEIKHLNNHINNNNTVETRFIASNNIASSNQMDTDQKLTNQDAINQDAINRVSTVNDDFIAGGCTKAKNPMLQKNLSTVIRWYKAKCSFAIRENYPHFAWQTRFHEHIIRDAKSYWQIASYIHNNLKNWREDENYVLE